MVLLPVAKRAYERLSLKGSVDRDFYQILQAVGEVIYSGIGSSNLRDGLSILVSRDIGAHGATIFFGEEEGG